MNIRAARLALSLLVIGFGLAPVVALARPETSTKRHTWTVVLLRDKVDHVSCSPRSDSPYPVFRRGRGDQIQFVSRDDNYWIRFRTPSPLRLKGDVVQRFEVHPIGTKANPVFTFTTDAPPEGSDWERFPFEVHVAQDMPKDGADQPRDARTGHRPAPPSKKEMAKKKLEVDLVIDAVK